MNFNNQRGMSLVEALISVVLISVLLTGILGTFIITRLAVDRAKHRMMAMNTIRQYMEQEISAHFSGGHMSGNYYTTVSSSSPITFTIDDMGTISTSDDLTGTIRPDPYPAERGYYQLGTEHSGDPAPLEENTAPFKKIGFVVEWKEKLFGGSALPTSSERAVVYVGEH